MLNKKRNRKGISELVSYVLLITLSIAIAGGTYVWLKSLATPPKTVECPDVSLWIINDTCYGRGSSLGNITFFLQNKGRIDISGFKIQASEKSDEVIPRNINIKSPKDGRLIQNQYFGNIGSSETVEIYGEFNLNTIKVMRITPMKQINGTDAYCTFIDFQVDDCILMPGGPAE